MKKYLFLGDSITDADHLFDPENLGYGYVSLLARHSSFHDCQFVNRGHEGFTIERIFRMLQRDGLEDSWDVITLLAGVNDIPVELFTSHTRIPDEFSFYYRETLQFLSSHTRSLVLVEPFLFDVPAKYAPWHTYVQIESQIIQDLASSFHAHFLPMDQYLRESALCEGIDTITTDGIHLTSRGNQLLANRLAPFLR